MTNCEPIRQLWFVDRCDWQNAELIECLSSAGLQLFTGVVCCTWLLIRIRESAGDLWFVFELCIMWFTRIHVQLIVAAVTNHNSLQMRLIHRNDRPPLDIAHYIHPRCDCGPVGWCILSLRWPSETGYLAVFMMREKWCHSRFDDIPTSDYSHAMSLVRYTFYVPCVRPWMQAKVSLTQRQLLLSMEIALPIRSY